MRDGSLHLGDMLFHRFWCFDIENDCKFGFVKIEKTMKKNRKNTEFSETIYLRQRVRKLPVGKCYLSKGWEKSGEAVAIVTRCHPKGTFTVGIFLIDTFCIGIRDSFYRFNIGRGRGGPFVRKEAAPRYRPSCKERHLGANYPLTMFQICLFMLHPCKNPLI